MKRFIREDLKPPKPLTAREKAVAQILADREGALKKCTCCGRELPHAPEVGYTFFGVTSRKSEGKKRYRGVCKECVNTASRELITEKELREYYAELRKKNS